MSDFTQLAIIIILSCLSLSTIIQIVIKFIPLPPRVYKFLAAQDINYFRIFIPEIIAEYECLRRLDIKKRLPSKVLQTAKKEIVSYIVKAVKLGNHVIGKVESVNIKHFINMREILLNPYEAERITDLLLMSIRSNSHYGQELSSAVSKCGAICCHRNGSITLAYEFAKKLNLPLILISDGTYIKDGGKEIIVEGVIPEPGCEVIFVDDSTTTGRMIEVSAKAIRKQYTCPVLHAILLFYRMEGEAKEHLESQGICIHPLLELNDKKIEKLMKALLS